MSWFKPFIAACAVLALAGCGFTPMYGKNTGTQAGLSNIAIGNIADREGQYLRNTLIDRFYVSGTPSSPAYRLDVTNYGESVMDLDITPNSTATRRQIRITAEMILTDMKTGDVVLRRPVSVINSFNVLDSQFSTRNAESDARNNVLNEIARRIEMQTALYFDRK